MNAPYALLASCLLSTVATAQITTPIKILSAGDSVPGTGQNIAALDLTTRFRVNSSGDWVARVRLDDPNTASDGALLRNGELMFREGDPVQQPVGGTAIVVSSGDVSDAGDAFFLLSTSGWPSPAPNRASIYRETQPILTLLDPIDAAGFSSGTYYQSILGVSAGENGFLLVTCSLVDPTSGGQVIEALVRFELDAAGNRLNEVVLATAGQVLPGQTAPLDFFYTNGSSQSLNGVGDGTFNARLTSAAGAQGEVVYASGTLIAQSSTPSPIPGRDFGTTLAAPSDSNDAGSWIVRFDLDSSNPLDDEVILSNGAIVAQKGSPAPVFGTTFSGFQDTSVHLDHGGVPYFGGTLDGVSSSANKGIFRGGSVLVRTSNTSVQGQILTDLTLTRNALHVSDDGNFLQFMGELDGSEDALILLERNISTLYCSAEPNSSGSTALLQAMGSSKASFNAVSFRCLGLPSNQPGLLLASMVQDDVFGPGGSQGRLCLGAPIARFLGDVQNSGGGSIMIFNPDLSDVPLTPAVAVQAGETWNFQVWYRDMNPGQTSNFSFPVSIEFR